jgi:hypothetical protein
LQLKTIIKGDKYGKPESQIDSGQPPEKPAVVISEQLCRHHLINIQKSTFFGFIGRGQSESALLTIRANVL